MVLTKNYLEDVIGLAVGGGFMGRFLPQKMFFFSKMSYLDRESKNKQKSLRYFVCYPHCFCVKTQKCSKWSPKNRVPVINRVPSKVRVFWD